MDYFVIGKKILQKFINSGYEAYFVGGAVRDRLLGLPYNDIDIATNALPEQICKLFNHTYLKGIKYNSIVIKEEGFEFETTTYRIDKEYLDHRHPQVEFTDKLALDLARRDFTINAMAMDINGSIIDLYDGRKALSSKIIKTVNDPFMRFYEDALRMLRAFYFVAKLGFAIEETTFDAINEHAHLITNISNVRVIEELTKLIKAKYCVQALCLLTKSKMIDFLPGLKLGIAYLADKKIEIHDPLLLFSICFNLNDGIIPEDYVFSREFRNKLKMIISLSLATEDGDFNRLILYSNGLEICLYANMVNFALGKNENQLVKINNDYESLPIKKTCDLAFKGQDIMELTNRTQASWIGDIVDKIKYEILINNLKNDYETIKKYVLVNKLLD